MVLRLRSYIAISFVLHIAVFAAFNNSARQVEHSLPPPRTITLRSKPREANRAVVEAKPAPVVKPKTQKTIKTPVLKTRPVFRPDAPPAPPVLEKNAPTEIDDTVETDTVDAGPEGSSQIGAQDSGPVDLTRDARLVTSSIVKPEYTKEAKQVRLQGLFAVDVHLDAEGKVLDVELVVAPGYGMDERIVAALRNGKYLPKRDATGKGLETWTTVQFKLEMP